ncbi:MAG: transcription-repair coupling factor [Dictyoglomus sp.]|uniref:transcription-repair coupling factor n=1 Tax=Dictyoglomus sp. TaxID=28205 RepID=UPI003D133415
MSILLEKIIKSSEFNTLERVINSKNRLKIFGIYKGIYPLFLLYLKRYEKPVLWITNNEEDLNIWEDLQEDLEISILPSYVHLPYERPLRSPQIQGKRLRAISNIIYDKNFSIIASLKSLIYPIIPKDVLKERIIKIRIGEEIAREKIEKYLAENFYQRLPQVEKIGDYSIRGGILDIFSPIYENPIRIEFFGDEITSIRFFNLEDKRSIETTKEVFITPISELIANKDEEKYFLKNKELKKYIFSYLPPNTILIFENYDESLALIQKWTEKGLANLEKRRTKENLPEDLYLTNSLLESYTSHYQVLDLNSKDADLAFSIYSPPSYQGTNEFFEKNIKSFVYDGWEVYISSEHQDIVRTRLKNLNVKYLVGEKVREGFLWEKEKILVITDYEIFGKKRKRKVIRYEKGLKPKDLYLLKDGDYVVHVNYGIGIFRGLKKLKVDELEKEFIYIEYANNSFLYVPLEEMHLIQRYVSSSPDPPQISRLESRQWEETKRKVKESAKEIAEELLKIYAQREITKGFAFSPDSPLQEELEASFPYIETEDQIKALREIKKDMESTKPMERVLIGDVGFGKTELALRASFKAVLDGKQVAILVPTTILAYQHWKVFKERLEVFPVNVEILSRLKPKSEQKRIIEKIRKGEIDIIIGTHRILQKDVEFKDLGLIIIDEEHRFGVLQKEAFKKKYPHVDILYLSATPIPRTLSMVLSGIRQFSVLETPPENRLPIQTFVVEYNPEIIQEGIRRELERGGQVYYVCNDIERLEKIREELSKLVPEATYAIAHGKMDDEKLTEVMSNFYDGKIDVLIATTIIESGIDVPNANTLFVENAEHMGLAQLYQLRGRIGRSYKQAYAYFLHAPLKKLSLESIKRLEALKEFSSLGSGLRLALRDLEIRGAGKILGKEQHGHINSVGFYLYLQLLEEAINELKSNKEGSEKNKINCHIIHPFPAIIPEYYISQSSDRIYYYQKLAHLEDINDIEKIKKEMEDIYGPIPDSVENLCLLSQIKFFAEKIGIEKIEISENQVKLTYSKGIERTLNLPKGDYRKKAQFLLQFLKDISNIK